MKARCAVIEDPILQRRIFMKKRKSLLNFLLCATLFFCTFFQGSLKVSAINTVFMVPPIDQNYVHNNTIYLSPNYNITALKWGYGTTVDILNTTGNIDALLAEVTANVTPTGGQRIMGIYMEGAGLSDANAATISSAGWSKVEMYYDTYFVACLPAGAMHPNIQLVTNEKIGSVLEQAGFTDEFAVLEVTDVNSSWAYLIKYDPALSFLHGASLHMYKYQPDLAVFLEITDIYFESYGRNFLEWYDPQLVDPDVNGFYVAVGQALPSELVCTPEEAAELRANPPLISNTEGNIQWEMAPGLTPENFSAEAVVTSASETEVNVDFAYSGELPEGTEVTVQIPQEIVTYTEGMELFLYYCNPETQMREFVSSGIYTEHQVTFSIYHCSEYVITSEYHGESYMPEPESEAEAETEVKEETNAETEAETEEEISADSEKPQELPAVAQTKENNGTRGMGIAVAAVAVVIVGVIIIVSTRKRLR